MRTDFPVPVSPMSRMWLDSSARGRRTTDRWPTTRAATRAIGFSALEHAEAVAPSAAVECADAHELGALQSSAQSLRAAAGRVVGQRDAEADDEHGECGRGGRCREIGQGLVAVDPFAQQAVQVRVVVRRPAARRGGDRQPPGRHH